MVRFIVAVVALVTLSFTEARLQKPETEDERRTQSCSAQGFSAYPYLGQENSQRLLLKEGAITSIPRSLCNNAGAKNVILVIGDGMGWEMTRAGSIAKQVVAELKGYGCDIINGCPNNAAASAAFAGRTLSSYYTEGKGSGLSFQNLPGFSLVTTGATVIGQPELANHYAPGRSLIAGSLSSHDNRMGPLLLNSCGFPIDFNPLDYAGAGGNMVLWDDKKGGKYPWDARYFQTNPDTSGGFDITYIMQHATDSANTAGCLATGHKAAVGMLSVDLYEESKSTLVEDALFCNKAGGVVSSVPQLHATPGAFVTHSNSRGAVDILRQNLLAVNPTFVSGTCASRLYPTAATLSSMRNGTLSRQWTLLEQSSSVLASNFYDRAQNLDPDDGSRLMVCLGGDYSASLQANLPFRGVDSSYSQRVCERSTVIQDPVTRLPTRVVTNSTICNYYPTAELANIPNITTNVIEGLKFLAKDNQGFFMMYEQGDIDWAAHANHMDDMLGAMFDIDDTVTEILKWISQNGGWARNALYVTADHDHYLTLLPDFPEKLARLIIAGRSYEITPRNNSNVNPQDLANAAFRFNDTKSQIEDLLAFSTWSPQDIVNVGHFWGPRGSGGNGWGSHSTRPVPLYYNGDDGCIEKLTGTPYQVLGRVVPGIEDKIDQTHLHACMLRNLFGLPPPPCVPTYAVYSGNLNYWYKTITPGGTIATPPCEINIEARFCTPPTGPVTIQLLQGGNVIRSRVEALAPYFLFGDSPANVLSGSISPGTYEIRTIVGGNTSATTAFTLGACV